MDNATEPIEFAMTINVFPCVGRRLGIPRRSRNGRFGRPLMANVHWPADQDCIKLLTLAKVSKNQVGHACINGRNNLASREFLPEQISKTTLIGYNGGVEMRGPLLTWICIK